MRYFIKYSPEQAFYNSVGAPLRFPDFGNGHGGVATNDAKLISEFTLAIAKNKGGLSEVSASEFESIKKKQTSSPNSKPFGSAQDLHRAVKPRRAAADANPRTIQVPTVGGKPMEIPAPTSKPTGFKPRSVVR